MQAIVGLSRGISRALVQGVVQRSQGSTEASQRAGTEDADSRLGRLKFIDINKGDLKYHNLSQIMRRSISNFSSFFQ